MTTSLRALEGFSRLASDSVTDIKDALRQRWAGVDTATTYDVNTDGGAFIVAGYDGASALKISAGYMPSGAPYPQDGQAFMRLYRMGWNADQSWNPGAGYSGTIMQEYFAVGFRWAPDSASHYTGERTIVEFKQGNFTNLTLKSTSDNKLKLYRGTSTLIATSSTITGFDTMFGSDASKWAYIQMKSRVENSSNIIVEVNGVEVVNVTGVDTDATGASNGTIDGLCFRFPVNAGVHYYLADIYVVENDTAYPAFLGGNDGQCVVKELPLASDLVSDFSATNANHYQDVDDVGLPDGDATRVYSTTSGDKDIFGVTNTSLAGKTIKGVDVWTRTKKGSAAEAKLKIINRIAGTDYQIGGNDIENYTDERWHNRGAIINPADSAAFEQSDLTSIGIEVV